MLLNIWQTVYPILIAILFFELIILVNEGGHYVAARLMKIKVNEFSIGMGPKIFQKEKNGCKYTLRLILFGGYCSMEGESEESDSEESFAKKKVSARILVVVAGAVMNLILGFIVVVIIICSQNLVGTTTVAKFDEGATSSAMLQVGDTIKAIDGMRTYNATDVSTGLTRSADEVVELTVIRDGEEITIEAQFSMVEYEGTQYISMDFWLLGNEKTVSNVISASFSEFLSYVKMVFLSVHDVIVGRYGLSDLSGPVGAVSVVSTAVKTNVTTVLKIMALLTINIGLFNLFTIPSIDGWRLFLLIFEGVTRKKLPQKFEWAVNAAGLVLLLSLMCLVTFSDITKLF